MWKNKIQQKVGNYFKNNIILLAIKTGNYGSATKTESTGEGYPSITTKNAGEGYSESPIKNESTDEGYFWITTGRNLTFTNWYVGYPKNSSNNPQCVQIWGSYNLTWDNYDCTKENYIVCERKVDRCCTKTC